MKKMISVTQAAAGLNLNPSRIRALCDQGRIVGAVKDGRNWVIPVPTTIAPPPPRAVKPRVIKG